LSFSRAPVSLLFGETEAAAADVVANNSHIAAAAASANVEELLPAHF
jgi:hypothetical protein